MKYTSPVWGFTSKSNTNSLKVVQNRALRIIREHDWYVLTEHHSNNEFPMLQIYMKIFGFEIARSWKYKQKQVYQKGGIRLVGFTPEGCEPLSYPNLVRRRTMALVFVLQTQINAH